MIKFLEAIWKLAPIRIWAICLGGPVLTLYSAWIVWIIWQGPWLPAEQPRQLDILGKQLWSVTAIIFVIIVALAAVTVRARTLGGSSVDIGANGTGGEEPAPISAITTTTKTEVN